MVSRFPMVARSLAGFVVLAALSVTARADVVVPNSLTSTEGNSSTALPFDTGSTSGRVQMILDASQFTAAFGAGNSGMLDIMSFRYDGTVTGPITTNVYNSFQIKMSQTSATPGTASTNFATNIGAQTQTTVFNPMGPIQFTFPPNAAGPPRAFTVALDITNFLYNPNLVGASNLLIDVTYDYIVSSPLSAFLDASTAPADVAVNNTISANSAFASTGTVQGAAIVTNFSFISVPPPPSGVPEPGSIALMSVAVASGLGFSWMRRRRVKAAPVAE